MAYDAPLGYEHPLLHAYRATHFMFHGAYGDVAVESLLFGISIAGADFMEFNPTEFGGNVCEVVTSIRLAQLTSTAEKLAELTPRQRAAALLRPALRAAFKGERVDTLLKARVADDKILSLLRVKSPQRFKPGPDFTAKFFGKETWWDLTTTKQWAEHVIRYGPGGRGIFR